MSEKRFELRQNSDGAWWLFNNEDDSCLMISKNFASLSDICIVLNQLSDSNEGLILDRNRQEEKLDIARRNLSKQLEKIGEQQEKITELEIELTYYKNRKEQCNHKKAILDLEEVYDGDTDE